LNDYDDLHERATDLLIDVLPGYFSNTTDYTDWSFESVIDLIQEKSEAENHSLSLHHRVGSGIFQFEVRTYV